MNSRRHTKQPYEIKGVNALFGEVVEEEQGSEQIWLDQISLPKQQPRRYFDPQAMQELTASVKQHGILQPLLVRPVKGKYELVAGERRYRAASEVGLEQVPVIIREMSDEDAVQFALLENLQREDLNPVEETEAILQLLAMQLGKEQEAIISLLNQAAHPERSTVDNVIHSEEWQILLNVFSSIGKFNPESFRTNRLPLLNLPDEILSAVRTGKIAYTKARVIARIQDQQQRNELLEQAIAQDLSLNDIKTQIKESKPVVEQELAPGKVLVNRMSELTKRLKKSKAWEDRKKRDRITKLLDELERLTGDS